MANSILKLIIEKGPRNGEALEFNSRSKIRIGRVVKGNSLTIKDSGISSKHLVIQFDSNSSWHVTDLDSSNGTIVNSSKLKPFVQFAISHGDEIKIGELTSIRVEIGEVIPARRNTRRQVASKSVNDSKVKVEEVSNLGGNAEIGEEINNYENPRKGAASTASTDLGGNVEINNDGNSKKQAASKTGHELGSKGEVGEEACSNLGENVEINNGRNPKKRAASKKGGKKVEVPEPEEACLNLVEESSSMVMESKEEYMEKAVEGNRRGRGRGRPKKVNNNLGVSEDVESVQLKLDGGVGTRRTRSTRRGDVELLSLDDLLPTRGTRKTRSAKNVEDVVASSLTGKVGETKGLGTDDCVEVESISIVENKKPQGGRGRKKVDNVRDAVAEENTNCEALGMECYEMVVDSRKQPCDEPVDGAPEKNLHDDTKNEQLVEVVIPEQERDSLSAKEKHCAELTNEVHHVGAESLGNDCGPVADEKMNHEFLQNEIPEKMVCANEQPCDEPLDDPPEQSVFDEPVNDVTEPSVCHEPVNDVPERSVCTEPVSNPPEQSVHDETKIGQLMEVEVPVQEGGDLSMGEKCCGELMVETNQQDKCVSLPLKEKDCVESMVEPTQRNDCDAGPSHVEQGVCDGLRSDAVFDDGRIGELENEEIDKESETNCSGRNKGPDTTEMPDLEKMTLGDWFTFLETYLPKQIKAATDEIIEDMQKRSAQFDEYVLQHQKEKRKLPLATDKERS